jgi:hypothetical protein
MTEKKPAATEVTTSRRDAADSTGHLPEQLSFLPPPPFNPSWPTKGTRDDLALQLFLDGQTLDHEDFFAVAGSWRLSDAVFHLRDGGWPIASIAIPEPSPKCPGREIVRYHLPAKYATEALSIKKGGAAA